MNVAVIGLGYIGLPTAALIASKGIKVVGVDVNKDVINIINEGKIHIVEPQIDILVKSAVIYSSFLSRTCLKMTLDYH